MPTPEDIRAQVQNICSSRLFRGHGAKRDLLQYLVEAVLEGRTVKPGDIARDVLDEGDRIVGESAVRAAKKRLADQPLEYYRAFPNAPIRIWFRKNYELGFESACDDPSQTAATISDAVRAPEKVV